MTGRSRTLPWWLEERRGKDDRKQNTLAPVECKQGSSKTLEHVVKYKGRKVQSQDMTADA
jgi:hypothetical protein